MPLKAVPEGVNTVPRCTAGIGLLVGAVIGGWIFNLLGIYPGFAIIGSILVAFVGAVILLWLVRLFKKA